MRGRVRNSTIPTVQEFFSTCVFGQLNIMRTTHEMLCLFEFPKRECVQNNERPRRVHSARVPYGRCTLTTKKILVNKLEDKIVWYDDGVGW
eukprot:scaffold8828_cov204-Amphora_coffeaeformis.AAC.13